MRNFCNLIGLTGAVVFQLNLKHLRVYELLTFLSFHATENHRANITTDRVDCLISVP